MKKIPTKKGEEISTPWLTTDEAALYCGVTRSYFVKIAKDILKTSGSRPKFHVDVLDTFMKSRFEISCPPDDCQE